MTETFAALLLAHVLTDFVFQTNAMAAGKEARRPGPTALHGLIVLVTATVALVPAPRGLIAIGALTLLHVVIDLGKSFAPRDPAGRPRLGPFLADQALHIASLAVVAALWPDLWRSGAWSGQTWLPPVCALLAGAIVATRAGGFAVGLLMAPMASDDLPSGLPDGGRMIGWLERGLIFILVIVNQPAGIGFLIAAKSVLRFDTASKDTKAGEYVIIGTLASFGWALVSAYATLVLARRLGFVALTP